MIWGATWRFQWPRFSGQKLMSAIHGDMVVWSDNRDGPDLGTSKTGCTNCSDNRFDVYSYNVDTAEEKLLVALSPSEYG